MLGSVGEQLVEPLVIDLHLQLFVEAVRHLALDAVPQRTVLDHPIGCHLAPPAGAARRFHAPVFNFFAQYSLTCLTSVSGSGT